MSFISTIADPHRDWLDERNRLMAVANDDGPAKTDTDLDCLSGQMIVIETRLRETPARTADGMTAKLLMLVQLIAEGNEIDEQLAAAAVREAQSVLDMGGLCSVSNDVRVSIGEGC